jgi:hypothetical protein
MMIYTDLNDLFYQVLENLQKFEFLVEMIHLVQSKYITRFKTILKTQKFINLACNIIQNI